MSLPQVGGQLISRPSLYTRDYYRADDLVVDSITALEAVLRIDVELSFKSAFRVAGLLAATDDELVESFDAMRSFYDTRSKIVHGLPLKPKNEADLRNEDALVAYTRRLLVGFLRAADQNLIDDTFYDTLDATLLHSQRRAALRATMGY